MIAQIGRQVIDAKTIAKRWFFSLKPVNWVLHRTKILSERYNLNLRIILILYVLPFFIIPLILLIPIAWEVKLIVDLIAYFSIYAYILILGKRVPIWLYFFLGFLASAGVYAWLGELVFSLIVLAGMISYGIAKRANEIVVENKSLLDAHLVIHFEPTEFSVTWQDIADYFDHSYRKPPWGEAAACNICKPVEDDGPNHRYSLTESKKLNGIGPCGHALGRFWTEERTRWYIKQKIEANDKGLTSVVTTNGKLAGVLFGYWTKTNFSFYFDVIYVRPEFRRAPGRLNDLRELIFLVKMRLTPGKTDFLTWLLMLTNPPIVAHLYLPLLSYLYQNGCCLVMTRTHRKSRIVNKVLLLAGFKPTGETAQIDEDRVYFERNL